MTRSEEKPVEPFVAWAQQREAARLGMWLFLASEAMMFGSLIMIAWFYRWQHPDGVAAAVSGLHDRLAAMNTVILVTSSLLMTLALNADGRRQQRRQLVLLLGAAGLGGLFLGFKGLEYFLEYREGVLPGFTAMSPLAQPASKLFMNVYFFATVLHGVHVLVAVVLVLGLSWRLKYGDLPRRARDSRLEMTGLYWHLVDAIWLLLFPTLYLVGR
ncbi:cytochrome c oxidase polypeptide III [Pseudomonas syringae]|nr:cytochrome c oxidase polypeptide III [Pseudomonas syringae]MCF5070655.1 cytochrome c oxidase polypeptide III [Pseudomonas syringae]